MFPPDSPSSQPDPLHPAPSPTSSPTSSPTPSPTSSPTPSPASSPAPSPAPRSVSDPASDPAPNRAQDPAHYPARGQVRSAGRRLALVHLGSRSWVLEPGQSVSFGRGSPCDIRLAHDPIDEHVSRRAGVLEHQGADLLVRNESTKRRLIFKPARGPERVLRPGEAITCLPHREFLVALDGRGGSHYVIQVTAPDGDGTAL